ncbi:MAG: DNRLRE domain-containing protein, partial [Planctomycetota bacterium]
VGAVNRRTILGFDVSGSVPAGSTITGVDIEITEVMNQFGGSAPFSVHEVSQDWGEGISVAPGGQGGGGPANSGDVTWDSNFFGSSGWTTPGGDFDAVASATQTIAFGGMGTRTINSTAGLVADVQGWLDSPAANFGWVIKTDEAMGGAVSAYGSRESANPPQLTITFLPPTGPVAQNIPFGAGCTAPSGGSTLTLAGVGVPSLGNPGYTLQISGGAPSTLLEAVSLGFGASPIPIPLPTGGGCNFLLDPALLAGTLVPDPSRAVNLPIPNMPGLAGVSIFFQAIQIDGSLFILGSNGLEAFLGN